MKSVHIRPIVLGALFQLASLPEAAFTTTLTSIDLEATHERYLILEDGWRFTSGDNPQWSSPDFDDSSWLEHDSRFEPDELIGDPWIGIGWFRLRLTVDESLAAHALVFYIHQVGASEIYVNGARVASIGTVSNNPQQEVAYHETDVTSYHIPFDVGSNLVAVRYSDHNRDDIVRHARAFGFQIGLVLAERAFESAEAAIRDDSHRGAIFTTVPATLALLHLLLFLFYHAGQSQPLLRAVDGEPRRADKPGICPQFHPRPR